MRLGTLAFLVGILVFQQLTTLPDMRWSGLLIPLILLVIFIQWLRLPALAGCGFLWALLNVAGPFATSSPGGLASALDHPAQALDHPTPALDGEDVLIKGVIASIPSARERGVRFEFEVSSLTRGDTPQAAAGRILLSWYQTRSENQAPPELRVGDTWQLQVRLKPPRSLMNPGGFDYEGWLFRHHLHATGYVRAADVNQRIATDTGRYAIDRLRQKLADGIQAALPGSPYAGVITALAIGEQRAISNAQWDVFALTGTTHLVAISGSHITLIAGLLFFLARWGWARAGSWPLRFPAPKAAAMIALAGAIYYAALAGFSVPVQRALIMVMVVMIGILWQRNRQLSHTLAVALLLVLLYDPLAVMEAGFWLSFGTVAMILFAMSNRLAISRLTTGSGIWWQWGRLHWLIAIGLAPVMLMMFQQVSLVSPLANFIAVPWMNVLSVPLTLLGTLSILVMPPLGHFFLSLAEYSIAALWFVLQWMSSIEMAQWTQHAPPWWALFPALVGVALLLSPKGLPVRWLGLVWLLPMFFTPIPQPAVGEVWFTLLDVGQGLSAVARTRNHTLVFDSGARVSENFDTGEAVVTPFLRSVGVTRLDTLIISHGDNDHIGGVPSILQKMAVQRTLSGVPRHTLLFMSESRVEQCVSGQTWQWDGVEFLMLNPPAEAVDGAHSDTGHHENNSSCVLRITTAAGSILLPGDIEKGAERMLLDTQPDTLPARILVAPHHGSKTSSTQDFIDAVHPEYILFPVGYRNRYGHPKAEVVARYQAANAQMFDSARHGAITFKLGAKELARPDTYRQSGRKYWHAQ